jgi:predicted ribonuclease YlaK
MLFILDTNAIMDFPELLSSLLEFKKEIFIVYNVLEELDGLKNSEDKEKRDKASKCLVLINEHISKLKFVSPNIKYLPEGMDKTKNDNKIISVALEYKERNPVIISHDIGVITKANSQNILVWDCKKDMQ